MYYSLIGKDKIAFDFGTDSEKTRASQCDLLNGVATTSPNRDMIIINLNMSRFLFRGFSQNGNNLASLIDRCYQIEERRARTRMLAVCSEISAFE